MNSTNDPSLRSFVPIAADDPFPIQNLPYGVFRRRSGGEPRVGVAIGSLILDLAVLDERGLLPFSAVAGQRLFHRPSLNAFMALGRAAWSAVRAELSRLLRDGEPTLRDNPGLRAEALVPQHKAELLLPVEVGDYTDFYSSRDHATNVGTMLRGPDNALMPNWLHLPVAYHGRASSLVVSGTDLYRPCGQTKGDLAVEPVFSPSRSVDFELEMGCLIGPGNDLGEPIPVNEAWEHVFGLVLVNDWSARDIQKWEYVPLGPFLSKNFGTSLSPWVVTLEALLPFRCLAVEQDPLPLEYLRPSQNWTYDIELEVSLQSEAMSAPHTICMSNFRHLYWSIAQQVAHHTIGGCNLRTGDLLASGTISGPAPQSRGCLLERTSGGREPLELPGGHTRRFLEDGDRVTMTGWCQGHGYRVGFGELTGRLLPARGHSGA